MKRTIALLTSVIVLATMLVLGVDSTSRAQSGCSLASFQGAYGILVSGFFQPPGTSVASFPSATVGILTPDGAGNISATVTSSQNGTIQLHQTFTGGTYTVNSNCTGSVFQGGSVAINFVIVARGSQVLFFSPAPGTVQSGVGIKLDQSVCSLASLQGTYGFRNTGFSQQGGTTVASSPSTTVGIITADGAGNLSGTATISQNGNIIQSSAITGTYTVNPDCTGSATIAGTSAGAASAFFVIAARGSQLLAITTVQGSVETSMATLSPSALQISAFTTIDVPGSVETDAYAISNSGSIGGDFAVPPSGLEHGFRLAGGSFSTVDFPGSLETFDVGVNDNGQLVGAYVDMAGKVHGFLFSSGMFTPINFPSAIFTQARGINNPGAIVGRYRDTFGIEHAYLFAGGTFSTIDPPGASSARAFGINDVGQVVGRYRDSLGHFHGFLFSSGGFTKIDFPGATFTAARGINNRGEIVGLYTDAAGLTHGFLLSGGMFKTMDFPGAIETDSLGINDVGQIVGSYADSSGRFHGFLANR